MTRLRSLLTRIAHRDALHSHTQAHAAEALELVAEYEAALVLARKALAPFAANADPRIPPGSSHRASRAVEKINAVLEKEGD